MEEDVPLLSSKKNKKSFARRKPTRCRQLVLLFIMLLLQILPSGIGYALSVVYVEIIQVFGTTRAIAALVQSVYVFMNSVVGVFSTSLMSKNRIGISVMTGSVISSLGLLMSSFAGNVYVIIVFTGVVGGFGLSISYLASFVVAGWAFPDHRTAAVAFSTCGASVGQFILPSLTNIFLEEFALSGTFLLFVGIALQTFICGLVLHFSREFFLTTDQKLQSDIGKQKANSFDWTMFKDLVFLVLLLLLFMISLCGPPEAFFLVDILEEKGYTRDVGSLFVSLSGLLNLFGRLASTLIGFLQSFHLTIHMTLSPLLVGLFHLLLSFLETYGGLLASTLLYSFFYGLVMGLSPAVSLQLMGLDRYPQVTGLRLMSMGVSNVLVGLLGGFSKDTTGHYNLLLQISAGGMAFVGLIFLAMFMFLKQKRSLNIVSGKRKWSYETLVSDGTQQNVRNGSCITKLDKRELEGS